MDTNAVVDWRPILRSVDQIRRNREAHLRKDQPDAVAEQNRLNLEMQYRAQFQQLLCAELASLRRVCQPEAKVFLDIATAASAGLDAPSRDYARAVNANLEIINGRMFGQQAAQADDLPVFDPIFTVQDLLATMVAKNMDFEKVLLYRQECGKRTAAHRHTVAMCLTAALDERLMLTAQQRAKLLETFQHDWLHGVLPRFENSWDQYCEWYATNHQCLPPIPDRLIVPLLDENQKTVWQQAMKLNADIGDSVNRNAQFGDSPEIQEIARMLEGVQDGP